VGMPARGCVLETYTAARSPFAAASAEARTVDVGALIAAVEAVKQQAGVDIVIVEGTGGLLVPLTATATVRDVARALDAEVVIVASTALGTINHTALSVESARNAGLRLLGVVMSDASGVDADFAAENASQIAAQCDIAVLGVLPLCAEPGDVERLADAVAARIDLAPFLSDPEPERRAATVAADRAHVWHPFTQTAEWRDEQPLVIRSGSGCWLVDVNGDRYLDGIGSLWANVHGHAHPVLDRALHEQAGRIAHSTFLGQTHEPGALLAADLSRRLPAGLTRVFYSEAGAAAVEVALRVALLAQRYSGHPERARFASLADGYHGDTAGAVSVGRSEPFHRGLDPLLFDVLRLKSPHLAGEQEALLDARDVFARNGEEVAALVIEPRIQGAAGMWPHSDAYLRELVDLARHHGALVICDEVATGFGRTGDLFASHGAGVRPDIVVLGKGLTGGYLPLSATAVSEAIFDLFTGPYGAHRTLYHGHTYSANPTACAVARASLQLFDDAETLDRGRRLASRLSALLQQLVGLAHVRAVRQRGVMVGIELGDPAGTALDPPLRAGRRVTLEARRRHVIVRPLGDVVVLNPPLVMNDAEADTLVNAVGESIAAVAAGLEQPVAV
jgi:adenosylmethionine-8-amino-7-oxononanoate aminotransferase